jgi:hypothetical protein
MGNALRALDRAYGYGNSVDLPIKPSETAAIVVERNDHAKAVDSSKWTMFDFGLECSVIAQPLFPKDARQLK